MSIKHPFYRLRNIFLSIRCWLRVSNNSCHWEMAQTAFESYPFDYGYLLSIEREKLKDMLAYFQHGHITTTETYAHMTRYISIAIQLLNIMLDNVDTFHYDGEMKFIELDKKDEIGEPLYELNMDELVYHCDVKVNMKNLCRFVRNESHQKIYHTHPHELYKQKAKHLYYKIRLYYTEEWWD